jgi:S-formylglutathione hydrolase FrmB
VTISPLRAVPRLGLHVALAVTLAAACAAPLAAEVRAGSFESASLGRPVDYVVDLPPDYEGSTRPYCVIYALHGLFEGPEFWQRRGLDGVMQQARQSGQAPDCLVVAVDGDNSFFVNGPAGRYEDLVTKDLIAHVESTYRVEAGPRHRALLGISMGGYAALRLAFTRPDLFAAVATHSAMLLEGPPSAAQGAGQGHMRAFHRVFGDPIDAKLWTENDPLVLARSADASTSPALFIDCGAQDRYGLARGHRTLARILDERGVPHTLELPPGDHGYDFVRGHLAPSLSFLAAALR